MMSNEKFTGGGWVAIAPSARMIHEGSDITNFSVMSEKTRGELINEGFEHYNSDPSNVDNINIVGMQFIADLSIEEFIANAHLIAAAPDMYKMLKEIQEAHAEMDLFQDIEELLAKARGEHAK